MVRENIIVMVYVYRQIKETTEMMELLTEGSSLLLADGLLHVLDLSLDVVAITHVIYVICAIM